MGYDAGPSDKYIFLFSGRSWLTRLRADDPKGKAPSQDEDGDSRDLRGRSVSVAPSTSRASKQATPAR